MNIPLFRRMRGDITASCRRLAVAMAVMAPLPALAGGLPTMEDPTQTGDGGIQSTAQGYLYDAAILGGLALCTAAFLWVGMGILSTFNEARARQEWSKFAATTAIGIMLLLVIIWLATEAAPILSQS